MSMPLTTIMLIFLRLVFLIFTIMLTKVNTILPDSVTHFWK